jgi:uncharacterized protein (DUF885 family)
MDRREFLGLGSAAALLPVLPGAARAETFSGSADEVLGRTFQLIFDEQLANLPRLATQLGLDKGALAGQRHRFDTRPDEQARREDVARTNKFIAMLEQFPPSALSPFAALNREVVVWDLKTSNVGPEKFDIRNPQSPYVISQQDGAYFSTPDFLASAHPIETRDDAEAYLDRLGQFDVLLDNETQEQRRQAARGFLAPGWSVDLALAQLTALRSPAAEKSPMVGALVSRAVEKGIAGDWQGRATRIVEREIYPAVDRQIAMLRELRPATRAGDGIWRVPDGSDIYTAALAEATTTSFTADEIHRIGLQQVAEISADLDKVLRGAGLTSGTVGERLMELNKRPDQLYPDTDAGRAQLIAGLNAGVKEMATRLPLAFTNPPTDPLDIRRVPPEIQEGAANGYYREASLDGSRPAIYFINLKSTADWPKYSLPALTFHEGLPGHHLQLLTAQKADLPMLRRTAFYSAYGEGWALYAEQVADELGAYKDIERAGYLQSYLFRAARLVVDTGLNDKRWTREQAIDYMVKATGFGEARVKREVERYCASPGQACSYKIGHIAWNRIRAKAQKALGAKFDIKEFHDVLSEGAMPLTILERRVDERVAAKLKG